MAITFSCESCGARFSVAERLAGKKARCKGCGKTLAIPEQSTPVVATSPAAALASAAVGPNAKPLAWLNAVTSQVALKPITVEKLQALGRSAPKKKSMFEEDENTPAGPYDLLSAPHLPAVERAGGNAPPRVVQETVAGYRNALLMVQRLFRTLNEWAFVASAPFLAILMLAIAARNYSWAVLGATVVVLLNLTRLVTGFMNLVVIPFRENPVQGVLFLIPPITVWYCVQNWNRVRKPVERLMGPALTIGLIILAFAFLPFLNGGKKPEGSVTDKLKAGASSLESKIQGKLDNPDLGKLKGEAREAIDKISGELNPAGGNANPTAVDPPK